MKVKKLISRGLTLGFILNSISVLSYANTEILNRYQTLEGEYITIDDSTEGNLEEIEIFGNTVQDPNNLEDIQSVGDLYVDDEGNPILDKQGRKQYKIDIISKNKNVLPEDLKVYKTKTIGNDIYNGIVLENKNTILEKDSEGYYIGVYTGWTEVFITEKIKINPNKVYSPFAISKQKNRCYNRAILFYDKDANFIQRLWDSESIDKKEIIPPHNARFMRVQISSQGNKSNNHNVKLFMLEGSMPNNYRFDLWESEQNWLMSNNYCMEPESNKLTILLPCQLQKLYGVADRLYWDVVKGSYLIEKNIVSDTINKCNAWSITNTTAYATRLSDKISVNNLSKRQILISNKDRINYIVFGANLDIFYNSGEFSSLEEFLNYINGSNIQAYAVLNTPELIKTNITSKIKVPIYKNKTYVFAKTQNEIIPTLKVTIDMLPQIAEEAVVKAQSDSNMYNISLARMYINMLSESLYKDQLQEQLNNIFSSDIVLEKKNATANVDLYIKSENILQMSLSTNSITFEDFSSVEDMVKENAVQISVNSSLPYSLNAYLPVEIQNSDKSNTMDKQILNIKENSEITYQTFSNTVDKIILKDNCIAGNNINHGIDIKLKGNIAHQKDVYKTTIKFEAQQK